MKRIIRLTESDLARIVRRVINEQGEGPIGMPNPATQGSVEPTGGPLTGTLVVRNTDSEVEFGQTIEFKFRGVKNSGKGPITIKKIIPMNSNMTIDKQVPFTLKPGETFEFTAKQKLVKGGTSLENIDENGFVEYEGRIGILTDGKKEKYALYCRQNLSFR
jgi:hypothetical protein